MVSTSHCPVMVLVRVSGMLRKDARDSSLASSVNLSNSAWYFLPGDTAVPQTGVLGRIIRTAVVLQVVDKLLHHPRPATTNHEKQRPHDACNTSPPNSPQVQ